MKLIPALLAASLALNAALLVATRKSTTPRIDSATAKVGPERDAPAANLATATAGGATETGSRWRDLESDNLEIFVARLRAAGLPPSILRGLVRAEVSQRYEAKSSALYPSLAALPYWQAPPATSAKASADRDAAAAALSTEQDDTLRRLLGPDYLDPDSVQQLSLRRQFGDLSPDKLSRVEAISRARNQARVALLFSLPDLQDKQQAIEREFRAQLSAALTPEELAFFELRNGETAVKLRPRMESFKPSEEEFAALYRLHRPIDDQYSEWAGTLSDEQKGARQQAEAALQAQIRELLGPARYADYQQAMDPQHETLNQIVRRLDLPLSAARAVVEAQASIREQAAAVRNAPAAAMTSAQRQAALAGLAREAETRLGEILGTRGFDAYRQYSGGWLRALTAP